MPFAIDISPRFEIIIIESVIGARVMELFRINAPRQQNETSPLLPRGGVGGAAPFSDYLRAAKFHEIIRFAAAKMHM